MWCTSDTGRITGYNTALAVSVHLDVEATVADIVVLTSCHGYVCVWVSGAINTIPT